MLGCARKTQRSDRADNVYPFPMRGRFASVCAFLIACSSGEPRDARETYDYLQTPAGDHYRVIQSGPILRGINTPLGLRITYVARALTKNELHVAADSLIGSLGPEMQLTGDKKLTVRARIGPASIALDSDKATYDLEYQLTPNGFQPTSTTQSPPSLSGIASSDDPTFPFREGQLRAAATASLEWLALMDEAEPDLDAIRENITRAFAAQIEDDEKLKELLKQRRDAGIPGKRTELYRLQQRVMAKTRTPGSDVLIVYACDNPGRKRVLERMTLAKFSGDWKIASYAFQPLP